MAPAVGWTRSKDVPSAVVTILPPPTGTSETFAIPPPAGDDPPPDEAPPPLDEPPSFFDDPPLGADLSSVPHPARTPAAAGPSTPASKIPHSTCRLGMPGVPAPWEVAAVSFVELSVM